MGVVAADSWQESPHAYASNFVEKTKGISSFNFLVFSSLLKERYLNFKMC
jgi:hypothetical protein